MLEDKRVKGLRVKYPKLNEEFQDLQEKKDETETSLKAKEAKKVEIQRKNQRTY